MKEALAKAKEEQERMEREEEEKIKRQEEALRIREEEVTKYILLKIQHAALEFVLYDRVVPSWSPTHFEIKCQR